MRIDIYQPGQASEHLTFLEIQNAVTPKGYDGLTTIDEKLPELFELVRKYAGGTSARVSNSIREPGSVAKGAKNSSHHRGNAFDVDLTTAQLETLRQNLPAFLEEAVPFGLGGLGVYPGHVHIDTETDGVAHYYKDETGYEWALRHWSDRGAPMWLTRAGNVSPYVKSDEILVQVEKEADKKPFNIMPLLFLALGVILYSQFKKS